MARVLIPMVDGFEEIEALTVVDVLRRGDVEVFTASLESGRDVMGAHNVCVRADALLKDVLDEEYDAIILPGGPGTPKLGECEELIARLRRQREDGKLLCAICAAPVVLCNAGIVEEDIQVTCYPTCVMDLDRNCAGVPVVDDSGIITGQAPGAAMLFALVVLQALAGEPKAKRIARQLVTDVFDAPEQMMGEEP